MCGIVGFVNYKQDVSRFRNILINMNNTLVRRGPDEDGYYIRKHIALAEVPEDILRYVQERNK